jgi:hypothetical protein
MVTWPRPLAVVVDQEAQGVARFAEVVRGDVGRHADRDAAGAVHDEVGQGRGQDERLLQGAVEVVAPIHRVLLDITQHLHGDSGEPRFGVAHGRCVVAVDRAEVALPVDQGVAQREVLRHAHHRFVHGRVAVRMVLAKDLAHDASRLFVRLIGTQPQVVHGVQDAAMHRLEPVAHVGQRPRDDDAHGVVEIRRLHLHVDVDLLDRS